MRIYNAHQNNLKNTNLQLPESQLIVVTGLSGSGKSSLIMDVIANEGVRSFMESLPAYNQQNAQTIPTAEVDKIEDLPPVIKVEQSKRFQSIHSTFGTISELTNVFRLLFARYSGKEPMSKSLFSFNHPKGACETCHGIGEAEYIDVKKLIADKNKTLREGAIATTQPNGYTVYSQVTIEELDKVCRAHDFNVDIPWKELSDAQKDVILHGSDRIKVFYGKHSLESRLRWKGLKAKPREKGFYKGMLTIMEDILRRDRNPNILKFASSKICSNCHGARIKPEQLRYKWQGYNFQEWMNFSLLEMYEKLQNGSISKGEQTLVDIINTKLNDLIRLGMGHYQLRTPSTEISSGDAQRIKLVNRVNNQLQGILYIFDEPSIGLSSDFQEHLLKLLRRLIQRGNSVMVVEHDLDFIRSADWLVELGPGAGEKGGEIIFSGKRTDFLAQKRPKSPTWLALEKNKTKKENPKNTVKSADFQIKPQELAVVAQKTPEIVQKIHQFCEKEDFSVLPVTDQPIGKTPRSNPATYVGLAPKIRNLFAKTEEAKNLKLTKSSFSFNSKKGRCETCQGAGIITLSMSIFGTVNKTCPACNGNRFKPTVLKAQWKRKNIAEVYQMSVNEAISFFSEEKKMRSILDLMQQLGLGYLKLGQPSNTLSGGEAQRIKLTKHFAKKSQNTLLQLNEPSIGLHQENVRQLLHALHQLKEKTAGIICFENHPLFCAKADQYIDNAQSNDFPNLPEEPKKQQKNIEIYGARTHSLKNLSLEIPKKKLTVVTGISGSGKSSLVIDTLHGFGLQEMTKQFSGYQRSRVGVNFQFDVDKIEGLTPTICITRKQKSFSKRTDVAQQMGMDKILRFAFSRKAQSEEKVGSASHFSTHHILGRCPVCEGIGQELLPDKDKLVLDATKSISDGLFLHNKALGYYGDPNGKHMAILQEVGKKYGFDLETPFEELNEEQRKILFHGTGEKVWKTMWYYQTKDRKGTQDLEMQWLGISGFLLDEYYKTRKNKNIKKLTALFSYYPCHYCEESGLNPDRLAIKLKGKSIADLKKMNFEELETWLHKNASTMSLEGQLIGQMQKSMTSRLQKARELHLSYLQLNRKSSTLSGGENQRAELIKQLNSPLKGITYLLDEPSAGLSMENIADLLQILRELIQKGNTVIVIEHNKEILLAADELLQIGPKAGKKGGEIIFQGRPKDFIEKTDCHPFLKMPSHSIDLQKGKTNITLQNVARHTLKKNKMSIPVGGITAISGSSGVGKTTLVKDILLPNIEQGKPIHCSTIDLPKKYVSAHYFEPQKLRSYRKTLLVDYLNFLPAITKQFATATNLKSKDFSYKNKKSYCPTCKGQGTISTSLDIVSNEVEICETCKGQRYQSSILEHRVNGKNIAEVLTMPLDSLENWFPKGKVPKKQRILLQELKAIGLAHLCLDQPVQTLSSGEKQRLLLLNWLQNTEENALYILDEPSIGLHYADIDLLWSILQELSKKNDVVVIDHNPYLLEKIGVGLKMESLQ